MQALLSLLASVIVSQKARPDVPGGVQSLTSTIDVCVVDRLHHVVNKMGQESGGSAGQGMQFVSSEISFHTGQPT